MRKHRKIKKEDIGGPSNFVHVEGYGQRMVGLQTQRSLDLDNMEREVEVGVQSACSSPAVRIEEDDVFSKVERRSRGSRGSLIPRHHRSTTTCIFPESGVGGAQGLHSFGNHLSIQSRDSRCEDRESPDKVGMKPTFGSLLNLSFLPLGLGKSSSSSSKASAAAGKTKRMSLLNLTASNLFQGSKEKGEQEDVKGAVMMSGYTRRRSFSNSRGSVGEEEVKGLPQNGTLKKKIGERSVDKEKTQASKENSARTPARPTSSQIPLAKLGRSKSSMSEFTKRPKLRLKVVPPVIPPPAVPLAKVVAPEVEETLPSPPPSPLPSPPKTPPLTAPPPTPTLIEEKLATPVIMRRAPKSPPRSRIIPLPSSGSVDSLDPVSPQYLTPVGGLSPAPVSSGESSFPLLSPTIPPSSTPFFPATQRSPGTPPVWPLQPTWPTSLSMSMQQTEPTIMEIPSPCKEEMDIVESEYDPVASIVDSFIVDGPGSMEESNEKSRRLAVCPNNIKLVSSALLDSVPNSDVPSLIAKLLSSTQELTANNATNNTSERSTRIHEIQGELLAKTVELWMEMKDDQASVEELARIFDEENQQAAESLRKISLSEKSD